MIPLEINKLDLKYTIKIIAGRFFTYLFLGLFLIYFTTLNPSSEGYINDVPIYFVFILFFILIIYSIKRFYHAKSIGKSFKVHINGDELVVEQKIEPKHTTIKMKEVKKLVQSKKGYIHFFKDGEQDLENFFMLFIKAIKNEEELIQYLSRYQSIELEGNIERKLYVRSIIIMTIIAATFLFFFMTRSLYFIIPISIFIISIAHMGFKEKGRNMDIVLIFLFLFALTKLAFAIWYTFI